MPKKILSWLIHEIELDISNNFGAGERYRPIRLIAERYAVSQQTAQRAVSKLISLGILFSKDRSGVFIALQSEARSLAGKEIFVVSANADPRFNEAFLDGIRGVGQQFGMTASLYAARSENSESLEFGEKLDRMYEERNAGGLIALAFRSADLAFYHLVMSGRVVISDVDSHKLPMLPSVQSDNRRHSAEAARFLADRGKTNILIAGYWPQNNTRHAAFEKEFLSLVPKGQCRYVHLSDDMSTADLYLFFRRFSSRDAVYAIDYAANHTVAPYFVTHDVTPDGNLLVYDSEYDTFQFNGLPPIRAAAPSLFTLGTHLAHKLVVRLRTGEWPEPLRERI